MPEKMTLYYMKRTGKVKGYCTGEQTMAFYGDDEEDYSEIMDFIHIKYDPFIIENREYYRVEKGELIFIKEVNS